MYSGCVWCTVCVFGVQRVWLVYSGCGWCTVGVVGVQWVWLVYSGCGWCIVCVCLVHTDLGIHGAGIVQDVEEGLIGEVSQSLDTLQGDRLQLPT